MSTLALGFGADCFLLDVDVDGVVVASKKHCALRKI